MPGAGLVALLFTLLVAAFPAAAATTVEILSTRDTTLYEASDGSLANGSGSYVFAGRVQGGELRRALLAFDDLSAVPDDVTITDVRLTLTMNRTTVDPAVVTVHRVTTDWGEGASDAGNEEGGGADSTEGDATWLHRFYPGERWAAPGGDFAAETLVSTTVGVNGEYVWSSPALVTLVQDWRSGARANHGLLLRAEEVSVPTAKRFGARESATPPVLSVTFVPGQQPAPEVLRISGLWIDPGLLGEGYNVIESDAGLTVFYFGYAADGSRLWLVSDTLDTEVVQGETLRLTMFRGGGGNYDAPGAAIEEWGVLELTVLDCGNARFALTGVDGAKVSEAETLARVKGSDCQVPEAF